MRPMPFNSIFYCNCFDIYHSGLASSVLFCSRLYSEDIHCVQVNLCQKYLFSHQLTHNMTKDCSSIYKFNTWKQQAQNMRRTCCAQKLFFVFVLTFKTICVHNLFSPCSDLVVFMYWTGKSMNNFLSYCGLVDPRISASDKDLPVMCGHKNTVFENKFVGKERGLFQSMILRCLLKLRMNST